VRLGSLDMRWQTIPILIMAATLTACSSLHEARAILGIMPPPQVVKPKRKNHGKNTKAQAEETE